MGHDIGKIGELRAEYSLRFFTLVEKDQYNQSVERSSDTAYSVAPVDADAVVAADGLTPFPIRLVCERFSQCFNVAEHIPKLLVFGTFAREPLALERLLLASPGLDPV